MLAPLAQLHQHIPIMYIFSIANARSFYSLKYLTISEVFAQGKKYKNLSFIVTPGRLLL